MCNRHYVLLQEEYNAEAAVHTVANAEAAALFMHLLARAQPEVQVWGLELWTRILRGSMANLAVCDRWAGKTCFPVCIHIPQNR